MKKRDDLMEKHLMDIDDYFDEKNQDKDEALEEIMVGIADSILKEDPSYWKNFGQGAKIAEAYHKEIFFELHEKGVQGCGYSYGEPEAFRFRIDQIKYAYAINGELNIGFNTRDKYTIPNLENTELLAFLINRQLGVNSINEEEKFTE